MDTGKNTIQTVQWLVKETTRMTNTTDIGNNTPELMHYSPQKINLY
jgi:hypothetical protein